MIFSFAGKGDVCDVWNKPDFDAEPLVRMGDAAGLPRGFRPMCAAPSGDGAYFLYGQVGSPYRSWQLYRARTVDGFVFSRRGMKGQGYIMVEALDEKGRTVEGFEADKCLIHDLDVPSRRIEWENFGGVLVRSNILDVTD